MHKAKYKLFRIYYLIITLNLLNLEDKKKLDRGAIFFKSFCNFPSFFEYCRIKRGRKMLKLTNCALLYGE